jgi:sec-independent protein translocase protein TatC
LIVKKKNNEMNNEITDAIIDNAVNDLDTDPDAIKRGDTPMSVVGHLDELRSRLIVTLITIMIATLSSFFFSDYILSIMVKPYSETGLTLNIFNLTEGFLLRMKASLITGVLVVLPLIIYEIWKYIAPAVDGRDRRFSIWAIIAAMLFFFCGMSITYFYILPEVTRILLSFTPEGMQNMLNASEYLTFVLLFSIFIGIIFELPIAVMILTRVGIITPEFLVSKRKYAIVLIFIFAVILTPPDVLSQILLAVPLILLYEVSILFSKLIIQRKRKRIFKEHFEGKIFND